MNALLLLWWTAIAMAVLSIAWMCGLIIGRWFRTRREALYAAERRVVDAAMVSLLQGDIAERRRLVPKLRGAHATAEALTEVLGLVRGADRDRLLEALRGLGVDDVIRRGAERGRTAGRLLCIEALVAFPGEETEGVLRRIAVTPGDYDCRLAAVRSLADTGAELSIGRLIDSMIYDGLTPSGPVVELFHRMAARWPQDLVVSLSRDDLTPGIRPLVVEALGGTGDYNMIPLLAETVGHPDMEVRAAAIRALGQLAHPAAAPALRRALTDESWQVRALAADAVGRAALANLAPQLEVALADSAWWVRHRAAGALGRLGPEGVERLKTAANGPDALASETASLALAEQAG